MFIGGLLVAAQMALCQGTGPIYAHIRGRVLDAETGKPMQGFMVEAYQQGVWAAVEKSISDARGEYDISGLQPGSYAVLIESPEALTVSPGEAGKKPLRSGYGKFFLPESDNIGGALQLTLAAGERRQLDVQLQRKTLSRLTGKIEVIGDRPENIVFQAMRVLGPNSWVKAFGGSPDKVGEFYVDRLPAGEYLINAKGVTADGVKLAGNGRISVAASDTVRLNVVLQPGILLRGRVRMKDESIIPRGLKVSLVHSDLLQFDRNVGVANENGAFEIAGVALGDYRVFVIGLPTGYDVVDSRVEITGRDLDVVVAKVSGDKTPTVR